MPSSRAAKHVVITGVVGPDYPGMSQSPPERNWTLLLQLDPWKTGDSTLTRDPLRVRQEGPKKPLEKIFNSLRTLDLMRITATEPAPNKQGEPCCELIKFHGPVKDADLEAVISQLRRAMTFEDEKLGSFVLDRALGGYSGEIDWCGAPVELTLGADKEAAARKCLRIMQGMVDAQKKWKKRIEDFAIAELLQLKNESWRDDDEPKVTAREFRQRMALRTISMRTNGRFEFWHDDGGLFCGHSIVVAGDVVKGPREADIPG